MFSKIFGESIPTLSGSIRKDKLDYILEALTRVIGHKNWFISGSFANFDIDSFNDIDVFFLSKADYIKAKDNMNINHNMSKVGSSRFANSYIYKDKNQSIFDWPVIQLISIHFGRPQKIFDTMDINVCKRAILPDGTIYADSTAYNDMHVTQINEGTLGRINKYAVAYCISPLNVYKNVIDRFVEVDDTVKSYYSSKTNTMSINQLIYNNLKRYTGLNHTEVKQYLIEQFSKKAPELLI